MTYVVIGDGRDEEFAAKQVTSEQFVLIKLLDSQGKSPSLVC